MSSVLRVLLAAAPLLSPASASAQRASESVRPEFGWTPGLTIEATERRSGVIREGAVSDSGLISMASYRIAVSEHPRGLLISHQDIRVERLGEFPSEMPAIERVNEVVADNLKYWMRLPDLVVTRQGEFVEVNDPVAFRHRIDRSIRPIADALSGGDPEIQSLLDQMLEIVLDVDFITALASDRWSSLADKWADTEWEVGAVYGAEMEAPDPLVSGPPIPYEINAGVIEKRSCESPAGSRTCAVFVMVSRPTVAAIGEVARLLADSLGAQLLATAGREAAASPPDGGPPLIFEQLELESRVELLADPVTLLPLLLEERQTRRGSGIGLGEPFSFFTEETVSTEFRYPAGS